MGEDKRKKVQITIEGGVVQSVEKPEDVVVEVLDFDTEGADPSDKRLRKNKDGETYWFTLW